MDLVAIIVCIDIMNDNRTYYQHYLVLTDVATIVVTMIILRPCLINVLPY